MKTAIIGDVHGHMHEYLKILNQLDQRGINSIQIGDMGVGFRHRTGKVEDYLEENVNPSFHRFIRGNHDWPEGCRMLDHFIEDGHVENDVMFIGGAWSIDWAYRREGISWWKDEQISPERFDEIIDIYTQVKPRVLLTHDCPSSVAVQMFPHILRGEVPSSFTSKALEHLLSIHEPEIWVFGHWHEDKYLTIGKTEFRCVGELSVTYI